MSKTTKKDIVDFIKKRYSTSNETAEEIVDAFLKTIVKLAKNGGVNLQNFGNFTHVEKSVQRKIYNFQTNKMETKMVEISKICFLKSRNFKL